MDEKVTVIIEGNKYNIRVKGNFATFLKKKLKEIFLSDENILIEDLLKAYVREISNNYNTNNSINKAINKMEAVDKIDPIVFHDSIDDDI